MTLYNLLRTGVFVLAILLPFRADAADVTLAWDSNVETDLAGYQVAYGLTSGNYTTVVDAGNRTMYSLTGLDANRTYFFSVRAYNTAGLTSPFSTEVSTTTPPATPLTLTNFVVSKPSPQLVGTPITFFASPTGGVPPYQYKWFLSNGLTSSVVMNWSAVNMFAWQPTVRGQYFINVWVRDSTSTVDAPQNAMAMGNLSYSIVDAPVTAPPPPAPVPPPPPPPSTTPTKLVLTSVTSSLPSPLRIGTTVRLTATATGGVAPLQFRWMLTTDNGVTWAVTQNWSTKNTYDWMPLVAKRSMIAVLVRSATNTTDYPDNNEGVKTVIFDVQ